MSVFMLWLMIVFVPNISFVTGLFFSNLMVISVVAGAFGAVKMLIAQQDDDEDGRKMALRILKFAKKVGVYAIVFALISSALPNERQLKYILGGYVFTNIAGLNELPPNILRAANKFLEDYAVDKEGTTK
jgi:uncharacterized BrkB/YihY/UPF0761 family membrane protein